MIYPRIRYSWSRSNDRAKSVSGTGWSLINYSESNMRDGSVEQGGDCLREYFGCSISRSNRRVY